jgi:transcriptional regulator with XRE-family HTH domain
MPQQQTEGTGSERTPFAIWLDSVVVPALFPNDAALARAMDVPQTYVYRWRRGVIPQVPALAKLAKATGTSVETLLRIAGYQSEGGKA